jgi:hypothetical protein
VRNNFSFRKAFLFSRTEYVKWLVNPRMIIMAVLLIFIKENATDPLLNGSAEMNLPLNALEPFIAVANSGLLVLILPLVYLTLISDFPRTDGNTVFSIIRTGRLNWLCGQLLFMLYSLVTFLTAVFLGSVIPVLNRSFWGNEWSAAITRYIAAFPEKSGSYITQLVPANLYNQLPPVSAALKSYLLLCCYMMILALVMLLFSILKVKKAGFLASGTIIALGVAGCSTKAGMMWFFPMANAIIWLHYTEYLREPIKPMWHTYIYFAAVTAVLLTACVFAIKRLSFETVTEVD